MVDYEHPYEGALTFQRLTRYRNDSTGFRSKLAKFKVWELAAGKLKNNMGTEIVFRRPGLYTNIYVMTYPAPDGDTCDVEIVFSEIKITR